MPVTRRQFDNPTPPRRCSAYDPTEDGSPAVKCVAKVVKDGLCGKHYTKAKDGREYHRLHITRHVLGLDTNGKVVYGTVGESTLVNWCNVTKCRRHAMININDTLWCQVCFMKEQKRLKRIGDKETSNIEATNG